MQRTCFGHLRGERYLAAVLSVLVPCLLRPRVCRPVPSQALFVSPAYSLLREPIILS